MIRQEDIRPGHENWWWNAGDRVSEVDPAGFVVRELDGTLEFVCHGCGLHVSGRTPEVRALMVFHLTKDPAEFMEAQR